MTHHPPIRELVTLTGRAQSTIREAIREKRLRLVRGQWVILTRRPCANPACQFRYDLTTSGKLCATCIAAGWRWCNIGKHVTQDAFYADKRACKACQREYDRAYKLRQQGKAADPPEGYERLLVIARELGYTREHLHGCVVNGWAVATWQRGPGCAIYIKRMAVYPPFPPESRRKG